MKVKQCSVCEIEFTCGKTGISEKCWCASLPTIMPANFEQDCRCPSCLAKVISEHINDAIKSKPHSEMLVIAKPYQSQTRIVEYIDYTIENGLHVFSQWYHLKRGTCCGNGCRHCPYNDLTRKSG